VRTSRSGLIHDASLSLSPMELKIEEQENCTTCSDGSSCCSGEMCCGNKSSILCCDSNYLCCNGTLCCEAKTESCCPDPVNGAVCCIAEDTMCCPPMGVWPSRCCPRWNVCCYQGRYGCCVPETMKPESSSSTTAYALYEDEEGNMNVITIDMTSGYYSSIPMTGPFNDWGEITRVFIYDSNRTVFYLLQANFTAPGDQHVITLYTVDVQTGVTVATTVTGAVEDGTQDVTGMYYESNSGLIYMGTEVTNKDNTVLGYNFYTVDPQTSIATLVSSYSNPVGEDSYAGWVRCN